MPEAITYAVGGTVQSWGGHYITRTSDDELLETCRSGQYAYILTSRQVGKSSAKVHAAEALGKGFRTVDVDVTAMGGIPEADWFRTLLNRIARRTGAEGELDAWWSAHREIAPAERFLDFLRETVLVRCRDRIVVFIDEVEAILGLPYRDNILASIRKAFQLRSEVPEFQNLSFVLIGSASPNELIADKKRTPFNIGRRIVLRDFTRDEAAPLADGLGLEPPLARAVLDRIFHWSAGHPYITQRLCYEFARRNSTPTDAAVDDLVGELFLGRGTSMEINLQTVRDMLTKREYADPALVLQTYRRVLRGERVRDDEGSPAKTHLELTGVVKPQGGRLVVRNRIYETVFDEAWIAENMPPETRLQRQLKRVAGVAVASTAAAILLLVVSVYVIGLKLEADRLRYEADQGRKALQAALQDREAALKSTKEALAREAEATRQVAVERDAKALALRGEVGARQIAEDRRKDAERSAASEKTQRERVDQLAKSLAAERDRAQEGEKQALESQTREALARVQAQAATSRAESEQKRAESATREREAALAMSLSIQSMGAYPRDPMAAKVAAAQALRSLRLGGSDARLALVRAADWLQLVRALPAELTVARVAVNPEGKVVAADNLNRFWSRDYGHKIMSGPPVFDGAGRVVAAPGRKNGEVDWVENGSIRVETLKALSHPVRSVAISPDGNFIVAVSEARAVALVGLRAKSKVVVRPGSISWLLFFAPPSEPLQDVRAISFDSASRRVLLTLERRLDLYDLGSPKVVWSCCESLSWEFPHGAYFFGSDDRIVAQNLGRTINTVLHPGTTDWNAVPTRERLLTPGVNPVYSQRDVVRFDTWTNGIKLNSDPSAAAVDPSGKWMVVATADGWLRTWPTDMGKAERLRAIAAKASVDQVVAEFLKEIGPLTPELCRQAFGSTCPSFDAPQNTTLPAN
jgi:hypothetical protein